MSITNMYPARCSACCGDVPTGTGAMRTYTGAAKKHAPRGAESHDFGKTLRATICTACESHRAGLRVRRTDTREDADRLVARRLGL
jgi:hypothetical protein